MPRDGLLSGTYTPWPDKPRSFSRIGSMLSVKILEIDRRSGDDPAADDEEYRSRSKRAHNTCSWASCLQRKRFAWQRGSLQMWEVTAKIRIENYETK